MLLCSALSFVYSCLFVSGLLFCLFYSACASGPQCLACSSISALGFCDHLTQCAEGEVCYVQKIRPHDGHVDMYTSGCISNQSCTLGTNSHGSVKALSPFGQITCVECCHGDYCNNKGCGDTGLPPPPARGPLCYKCQNIPDPTDCNTLTLCHTDEVCTIGETVSFGHLFTSGCRLKAECLHEGPLIGRQIHNTKRSLQLCNKCCSSDFCNQHCHDQHQSELSWTTWNAWSTCSSTCGNHGNQIRNRSCTNARGDVYTQGCDGVSRDERNCSGSICSGCDELYNNGEHTSGVYTIAPTGHQPLNVFCDMTDGGGWTMLQHRLDTTVSFNRNWTDYVTGFGDLRGDFWLGLEYIHILTSRGVQVIIDMVTKQGDLIRYSYDHFQVKNASTSYELSVSNDTSVNCSSKYRLLYNDGAKFTTPDRIGRYGCALHGSGWWFNGCSYFNLNGIIDLADVNYGMAVHCNSTDVVLWQTVMKVR